MFDLGDDHFGIVGVTHKCIDATHLPGSLRADIHDALEILLSRAQIAGVVRPDITAADLITLLKSLLVTMHENPDPGRVERIFAVLTDGLRPPPPAPA